MTDNLNPLSLDDTLKDFNIILTVKLHLQK